MANITNELLTIESGRYGEDVRKAIHDALAKLNQNSGGSALLIFNSYVRATGCAIGVCSDTTETIFDI